MRNDLVSVFNICHQAYALGEKGFKVEVFLFFPLASHTLHLIRILWLSVRFIIIAILILYNTGNWLVFFFSGQGPSKKAAKHQAAEAALKAMNIDAGVM